jgi:hypothetical protein
MGRHCPLPPAAGQSARHPSGRALAHEDRPVQGCPARGVSKMTQLTMNEPARCRSCAVFTPAMAAWPTAGLLHGPYRSRAPVGTRRSMQRAAVQALTVSAPPDGRAQIGQVARLGQGNSKTAISTARTGRLHVPQPGPEARTAQAHQAVSRRTA